MNTTKHTTPQYKFSGNIYVNEDLAEERVENFLANAGGTSSNLFYAAGGLSYLILLSDEAQKAQTKFPAGDLEHLTLIELEAIYTTACGYPACYKYRGERNKEDLIRDISSRTIEEHYAWKWEDWEWQELDYDYEVLNCNRTAMLKVVDLTTEKMWKPSALRKLFYTPELYDTVRVTSPEGEVTELNVAQYLSDKYSYTKSDKEQIIQATCEAHKDEPFGQGLYSYLTGTLPDKYAEIWWG